MLAAGPAFAQTAANDALYQQLGAQPGLVRLMDDFVLRLIADPRMNPFVKDTDRNNLKAHSGFDITRSNFNALVEVLQQSMDAQGIAFGVQNRLLAQLAPMHREIINTP